MVSAGRATAYLHGTGRGRTLDIDPSFGTFGGLYDAPGYGVWHTGATVRIVRGVDVFGRIDNLLDRRYEEILGFPALGRSAIAGIRIAAGR
jgi:vitamin B12 transporter